MATSEVKVTKLITNGIHLTDAFFGDLKKRVTNDIKTSKDLESFLARTEDYTTSNVLINSGYAAQMTDLIKKGLDTTQLRARQRELFLTTVDHTTTELISNVGDEVKATIREIAKMGYQKGKYHPSELEKDIEGVIRPEYDKDKALLKKVQNRLFKKYGDSIDMDEAVKTELDRIAKVRARTIARTEIKRSQTIADYISSKDAGCTHFKVSCMESACPICKEDYTNKEFEIDDTSMLPPRHPNCRCVALFYAKDGFKSNAKTTSVKPQSKPKPSTVTPTKKTTKPKTKESTLPNLTDKESQKYNNAKKRFDKATKMLEKLPKDDPRRIKYESQIRTSRATLKELEKISSNQENRQVTTERVVTKGNKKNSNLTYEEIKTHEEMADYFGLTLIEETTTQYGKSTKTYSFKDEKHNVFINGLNKFDVLETKEFLQAYDTINPILKKVTSGIFLNPNTKGRMLGTYNPASNTITMYSHQRDTYPATIKSTLTHEMSHALDCNLSPKFTEFFTKNNKEYRKIVREEGWGSEYSYNVKGSTRISEDFAETGSMVLNKDNPNIRIRLKDGNVVTAKEWCKMFPKKVAFFEKVYNSKEVQSMLA